MSAELSPLQLPTQFIYFPGNSFHAIAQLMTCIIKRSLPSLRLAYVCNSRHSLIRKMSMAVANASIGCQNLQKLRTFQSNEF
ncbi:MAG: hypothetical protein QNJ51_30625 [Calothrix sp. MO_167.B12]|nr:hypothetical protein [Calothrix sp. MO_167.B12]